MFFQVRRHIPSHWSRHAVSEIRNKASMSAASHYPPYEAVGETGVSTQVTWRVSLPHLVSMVILSRRHRITLLIEMTVMFLCPLLCLSMCCRRFVVLWTCYFIYLAYNLHADVFYLKIFVHHLWLELLDLFFSGICVCFIPNCLFLTFLWEWFLQTTRKSTQLWYDSFS